MSIYVCPGTYHEHLVIQNRVDLTVRDFAVKGRPAPLIDADGADYAVQISDSHQVGIRGLRITNAGFGVYAEASPMTLVRNTVVTSVGAGIAFTEDSNWGEARQNT